MQTEHVERDGEGLPAHIGKYRVVSRLGRGSTSEVFLARDDFLQIDVAIKRLLASAQLSAHEARLQHHCFDTEASLVGRLWHPNIVRIYDAVSDVERPYVVMEYVEGTTLQHFCRADALLPMEQVVEIGFKCAMALGHVNRLGLTHRDLKPANILASLEGDALHDIKITDFGSAFMPGADRTQIHRIGSLAYMSPEQFEGDVVDARSDIYSLGMTLYRLIAGRPAFDGRSPQALMNQILNAAPVPLSLRREGVPSALDALIRDTIAKDPAARPPDWMAVARRLAAVTASHELPRADRQAVKDSERFTLLRGLAFFTDFDDVALWEVVRRGAWRRYPAGSTIYRQGEVDEAFHILAEGGLDILREGLCVASLGPGTSVGEMAYLAPSADKRAHSVDVLVRIEATTVSLTPAAVASLTDPTQHLFDKAFNRVLVRRLHAAHEALHHPRRVL